MPIKNYRGLNWIEVHDLFGHAAALKNCPQTAPHKWNVYEHTRAAYLAARLIIARLPQEKADKIKIGETLFAVAFHDVGKPQTINKKDDGRITFHGHERVGADIVDGMSDQLLEHYELDIDVVARLIELHLRPAFLYREHLNEDGPSNHAILRLKEASEGIANELAIVALADFYAKEGEDGDADKFRQYGRFIYNLLFEGRDWAVGGGFEDLILKMENKKL